MSNVPSISTIESLLRNVMDPEIPVLSIMDLGVITDIRTDTSKVYIEMTPTFVGCPAIDMIKSEISAALYEYGIPAVEINVTFRVPWTSDRISETGRAALKKFWLSPPAKNVLHSDLEILGSVACPRCDGTNTTMKTLFGQTLCRSIHFCNDCREAFEQFKTI